jgi:hypothetical protein
MSSPKIPSSLSIRIVDNYNQGTGVPIAALVDYNKKDPQILDFPERTILERTIQEDSTSKYVILPYVAPQDITYAIGTASIRMKYTLPEGLVQFVKAYIPETYKEISFQLEGNLLYVPISVHAGTLFIRYQVLDGTTSTSGEALIDPVPEETVTVSAGSNRLSLATASVLTTAPDYPLLAAVSPATRSSFKVHTPSAYQKHTVSFKHATHVIVNNKPYYVPVVAGNARPAFVIDEIPIILSNGLVKLDHSDCVLTAGLQASMTNLIDNGGLVLKVNGQIVSDVELNSYSNLDGIIQLRKFRITSTDTVTVSYKVDTTWSVLNENINPLYIESTGLDTPESTRNLVDGDMELFIHGDVLFYRYTQENYEMHEASDYTTVATPTIHDLKLATIHLDRTVPEVIDLRIESTGVLDKTVVDWRSHTSSGFWGGEAIPPNVMLVRLTEAVAALVNANHDGYKTYFNTFLTPLIGVGSYIIILDSLEQVIYYHEDIFPNEA